MNWRTAHKHRRRVAKRQLKQARFRRLTPWQRDLVRAFENFGRSCGSATLHLRQFGHIVTKSQIHSLASDYADALAYDLPTKLTVP